ncbi:unnamed protein product [Zymoseptoria tritici ST99CH_1E4]|uniref:Uncharacterized protein n=1 Tax=Zymoseptoria tritici ST99CH_1E4 TaxID=1276532 RepID=A0A2H1GMA4_ZYMTR|nr:unnamed protein product [Zymoseptoria tritici ST99CH_1E4]
MRHPWYLRYRMPSAPSICASALNRPSVWRHDTATHHRLRRHRLATSKVRRRDSSRIGQIVWLGEEGS